MDQTEDLSVAVVEFRQHFDKYYLGAIPKLLDEEGMVLAFISLLTATECLAGLYRPNLNTGERFRLFIEAFFPSAYHTIASDMWQFRNLMVHAFNPMPFQIGCHQSRIHLIKIGETRYLNAEDLYADFLQASRSYFKCLYEDQELQMNFAKRVSEKGGGRPLNVTIIESVSPKNGAAV
jgi:hypothetical protein